MTDTKQAQQKLTTHNPTHELIADMAEEALQYVDRYYGTHHAISESVHRQIDVFCNHNAEPEEEGVDAESELLWGTYSKSDS
jgi:hypothetical protein